VNGNSEWGIVFVGTHNFGVMAGSKDVVSSCCSFKPPALEEIFLNPSGESIGLDLALSPPFKVAFFLFRFLNAGGQDRSDVGKTDIADMTAAHIRTGNTNDESITAYKSEPTHQRPKAGAAIHRVEAFKAEIGAGLENLDKSEGGLK